MMVHAFRKGICPGPFSESLIRNRPKTFAEIRRRAVVHIAAEGEVNKKHVCVVPTRPRAPTRAQPMRVHEAAMDKKSQGRKQPYECRKSQAKGHEESFSGCNVFGPPLTSCSCLLTSSDLTQGVCTGLLEIKWKCGRIWS